MWKNNLQHVLRQIVPFLLVFTPNKNHKETNKNILSYEILNYIVNRIVISISNLISHNFSQSRKLIRATIPCSYHGGGK